MIMFGARVDGQIKIAKIAKIYRVTIYENNAPIADYLPCLDNNNIPCMWENVTGQYIYNSGTGDFTYGEPITPTALESIYYLKKDGAWKAIT